MALCLKRNIMPESTKENIHSIFIERAPNSLTVDNLISLIQGESVKNIEACLKQLVEEKVIEERDGEVKKDYKLISYKNIPSKQYMNINGIKVPRLLAKDHIRPEDVNIYFESLANKLTSIERTTEERINEKLKEYWANIIILFGVFIGLFSLIITFVEKVELKGGESFLNVLLLNVAQVIPLAVVLAGFVYLLKKLFK